MTMIKCPQCGQTVLSVASVCPRCSYLLMQHATPQGDEGGFGNCRRCGKVIAATAVNCEYCGYPQRSRRHLRRGLASLGFLALVALGVVAVRAVTRPGVASDAESLPAVDTLPLTEASAAAAEPDSATVLVAPPAVDSTVVAQPDSQLPQPLTLARWTITWANVRARRSTTSAVVRILAPGDSVSVAEPAGGWWRVYERGEPIGFVAIDLLSAQPPEP